MANTDREKLLAQIVTVSQDWHMLSDCVAWMEQAERRCKRDIESGWLCKRHIGVAERKLAKAIEKNKADEQKRQEWRAERLPKWKAELAKVEAEMARLDPHPPTTDRAAYGGVGCTTTTRYQQRLFSDSRVQKMGTLVRRAEELRGFIGKD